MKVAAAQIEVVLGDIFNNSAKHFEYIEKAKDHDVDLILFPEMSLTGYCRNEARNLAIPDTHDTIIVLKEMAKLYNIYIVVGAPVDLDDRLYIGSYLISPDGQIQLYTKQYLHDGEEKYFDGSTKHNPSLTIKGEKIQLAICADIDHLDHPACAKGIGCDLYLASIFYSPNGIDSGLSSLAQYAHSLQMNVLMSNYVGHHWQMQGGGKSSFWNSQGELIGQLDSTQEGLLVLHKEEHEWSAEYIPVAFDMADVISSLTAAETT